MIQQKCNENISKVKGIFITDGVLVLNKLKPQCVNSIYQSNWLINLLMVNCVVSNKGIYIRNLWSLKDVCRKTFDRLIKSTKWLIFLLFFRDWYWHQKEIEHRLFNLCETMAPPPLLSHQVRRNVNKQLTKSAESKQRVKSVVQLILYYNWVFFRWKKSWIWRYTWSYFYFHLILSADCLQCLSPNVIWC